MVREQPFFFWRNLLWAEARYILLTGCKCFLNAKVSFSVQCVSTEKDCTVRVWTRMRGSGGLRRLSHGCKSSLLEQWLELTAVPAMYSTGLLHSSDALCHVGVYLRHCRNVVEGLWLYYLHYSETVSNHIRFVGLYTLKGKTNAEKQINLLSESCIFFFSNIWKRSLDYYFDISRYKHVSSDLAKCSFLCDTGLYCCSKTITKNYETKKHTTPHKLLH